METVSTTEGRGHEKLRRAGERRANLTLRVHGTQPWPSNCVTIPGLQVEPLAATNIWTGSQSDYWTNAANWSLGHVPYSNERVLIDVAANPTIVLPSGAYTVESLYCRENLQLSGGSLSVANGFIGGTVSGDGSLTKAGCRHASACRREHLHRRHHHQRRDAVVRLRRPGQQRIDHLRRRFDPSVGLRQRERHLKPTGDRQRSERHARCWCELRQPGDGIRRFRVRSDCQGRGRARSASPRRTPTPAARRSTPERWNSAVAAWAPAGRLPSRATPPCDGGNTFRRGIPTTSPVAWRSTTASPPRWIRSATTSPSPPASAVRDPDRSSRPGPAR